MLYILRTKAEVLLRPSPARRHIGARDFYVGDRGMCELLGASIGRSKTLGGAPHARVDFRSLVELLSPNPTTP
ncbi:hypothetical protein GW17_00055692 [Ensete ventricosum]|nr:hypothetical protein GW17_00055692 [Ensete ventricosum]